MRPLTRILMALATLAVVSPALAAAKPRTIAPPGDSAVSQYVEVVPGDTGASPPRAVGGQGGAVTSSQRRQLDRLGANGQTLVVIVQATAPQPIPASGGPAGTAAPGGPGRPSVSSGTGVSPGPLTGTDTLRAVSGAGSPSVLSGAGASSAPSLIMGAAAGAGTSGLGVALPGIIVACALGAVAYAVRQRRTRP